ncbi:MAG: hypothetical protein PHN82_10630 [bacterium]|nr:hypothetical protein [bacterium]
MTRSARLRAAAGALAALLAGGCAAKVAAPRIPVLEPGMRAPYGDVIALPEGVIPLKEAPEDIVPPSRIK